MAFLFSNVADGILNRHRSDLTYKGRLYLKKAGFLDVTNVAASALDNAFELIGQGVELKLISKTSIEPNLGTGKTSLTGRIKPWILGVGILAESEVGYNIEFGVDADFGIPGAFTINNKHVNGFYLLRLTVDLPGGKVVEFPCNSWVHNLSKYHSDRIFFSNELCLPKDTPVGLREARETDLKALRGDGTGERSSTDRIYDYEVYNDLGNVRPILGGSSNYPYPRRCRSGRSVSNGYENRNLLPIIQSFYIPSDEVFAPSKNSDFIGSGLKAVFHSLIPSISNLIPLNQAFGSFREVKSAYDQGFDISKLVLVPLQSIGVFGIESPLQLVNQVIGTPQNNSLLKFPLPQVIQNDEHAWMTDEEFGRQMLGGVNPLIIECLKAFPPKSKLSNATSALKDSDILSNLEGKSVQEALQQHQLFVLDYYDIYMPYLERINALGDRFAYASRTVLFLKSDGTLNPVAIELSTPSTQRVFTPGSDKTWELAKAHAAANDAGHHQLVSHWLRTHACIEPFIIATQRQLSALHPLNPFLRPHFKNTMSINALARQMLINVDGFMESSFTGGKYVMEMTAAYYKNWNFFEEGLPADLIKRGMATPDQGSKHGLKLVVEDYPYAADGLEIWAALEKWTREYLDIVYQDDGAVATDTELQAWWSEVINVGHADKKNDPWWGSLQTKDRLALVLTTIIWVASAHHAAVNFGQYAYDGYMPNHPTKTHRPVPETGSPDYAELHRNFERWYLSAVSRKAEAIKVMLAMELLSTHAEDEEYLGQRVITGWTGDTRALAAFQSFSRQLKDVDEIISERNRDPVLKNRRGHVHVPYSLLYPSSDKGLTGRGIPNSISI